MSNHLPAEVAKVVKANIYKVADEAKYLAMSRTEAGQFMDGLVKQKDVGGIIENYLPKHEIRHYIKDGVLNRYSKDKAGESYPSELEEVVKDAFGIKVVESGSENGVTLFKSAQHASDGKFVVVATGTIVKWETALRKILCFIAAKPFSNTAKSIHALLILSAQGKVVTRADKNLLSKALAICGAKAHIVGE